MFFDFYQACNTATPSSLKLAIISPRYGNTLRHIPKGIWVLGFVSMLMDISSEDDPWFATFVHGHNTRHQCLTLGIIEGLGESTALIVKVFSGIISDYIGKRKSLALFGYALGALTKPLFALASSTGLVLTACLLDRISKGGGGAEHLAMHWSLILLHRIYEEPPLDYANHWRP